MSKNPTYRLDVALLPDGRDRRFVIVDDTDQLHLSSAWLAFLSDVERSPNTVKAYGSRLAAYLTWTAQTEDWRSVSVAHLGLWRRALRSGLPLSRGASAQQRSNATVDGWMVPVRAFYEWADALGHVSNDIVSRMTEVKYWP